MNKMKANSLFRNLFRLQFANFNRHCSGQIKKYDEKNKLQKYDEKKIKTEVKVHDDEDEFEVPSSNLFVPYSVNLKKWNERKEVKRHVKQRNKTLRMDMTYRELQSTLMAARELPVNPKEFKYWLARRKIARDVYEQEFIPERYLLLRADLAAAHFIFYRGGAVKFYGDKRWVGFGRDIEALPQQYVPGLYVEYIDAVGCRLQHEGLVNITKLLKLKWLNLSGNEHIDNWCLDLLSGEYGKQLEHLDISNCYKVDHKGLSCCYRFEKLKTFNVTNIATEFDFRMACAMLEDLIPELDIIGVDYSIPEPDKFSIDLSQKLYD